MRQQSATAPPGPPPLLQRLYGTAKVCSLRDLLIDLSRSSHHARALKDTLVQPYDHTDYSQGLLGNTYCVVNPGAQKLAEGFTLQRSFDQLELLHRSIEALLQSTQGKNNVLCYGYRKKRPSASGRQLQGTANTEIYFTNSIADSLLSPPWQLLLSRIGDTLMLYLLLNMSMFSVLANECCLQLTGPSLVQIARGWRRDAALAAQLQTVNTTTLEKVTGAAGAAEEPPPAAAAAAISEQPAVNKIEKRNKRLIDLTRGAGPMTQDPDVILSVEEDTPTSVASDDTEMAVKKKRRRLPKWQRRKVAAAAAAAAAASVEKDDVMDVDYATCVGVIPSTQPLGGPSASEVIARMEIETEQPLIEQLPPPPPQRRRKSQTDGMYDGYSQWPRCMPKPTEMKINRNPVFYCSTFSSKPGFQRKHILNAVRGREDAGRVLYSSIFDPGNNPVGRATNSFQPKHFEMPRPPAHIPAAHAHVIPLLDALVTKAEKCPFGLLLNLYCPLPRNFLRTKKVSAIDNGAAAVAAAGPHTGATAPQKRTAMESVEKTEGKKDLDTLMDELYEMEQLEALKKVDTTTTTTTSLLLPNTHTSNDLHPNGPCVPPLPRPTTTATTTEDTNDKAAAVLQRIALLSRRRGKLTGLEQLILEAESQLDPAAPVGTQQNPSEGSFRGPQPVNQLHHRAVQTVKTQTQPTAHETTTTTTTATTTAPGGHSNAAGFAVVEEDLPCTEPQEEDEEEVVEVAEEEEAPLPPHASINNTMNVNIPTTTAPPPTPPNLQSLSTCFVPQNQVTGFVWAVVRRIVPGALLGDKQNRRALHQSIRRFVSLRRYEQMNVHQIMQGQKTSGLSWLHSPLKATKKNNTDHSGGGAVVVVVGEPTTAATAQQPSMAGSVPPNKAAYQQRQLMLWLGWLFSAVVVPLLRAHFFCTESEAYRMQVFYYRKPVWHRLASAAVQGLSATQFAPLPMDKARRILEARSLGVAGLRLLPKRVGMRFIVNMGKRATLVFKAARGGGSFVGLPKVGTKRSHAALQTTTLSFPSVNSMLLGVHQILKLEASRQPNAFGATVFGYNDTFCKLQPFIRTWKAKKNAGASAAAGVSSSSSSSSSKLGPYIVSVDVSRAFDHVDVTTLLELVSQLLQSENYLVVKYSEIVPCLGDVKVLPRKFAVSMDNDPALENFPTRAAQWSLTRKGKIFVDGVVYERISRNEALSLLHQHLTANLVRLKKVWHYQCRGIAQGSTLSTMLCCLYLAHVERVCLMPVIHAASPLPFSTTTTTATTATTSAAGDGSIFMNSRHQSRAIGTAASSGMTISRGRLTTLAAAAAVGGSSPGAATHSTAAAAAAVNGTGGGGGTTLDFVPPWLLHGAAAPLRMPSHSLLMRLVDDWLLVTHHRAVAEALARCMLGGIPAYNVAINPDKTKLSFPLIVPSSSGAGNDAQAHATRTISPDLFISGGGRFIKWCGLLLNVDSLEIQGDYTRYAGEHISTTLTLPLDRRGPGSALGFKICHYLRPKVHPLLLDPSINSPATIRVNVYQAFAIGAMKFHCYVRAMPAAPAPGSTVLMKAIETGITFMVKLTRSRRVAAALRPGNTVACNPGLAVGHVRYLGLHAFRSVLLRKKGANYLKELLEQLDEALAAPGCARYAKTLAGAVDPKRSTILDAILY